VLAQVRSTYFTRTNFSEYESLTYVLSGVAEPTDLIKDKNISPFNIGEKIYLEDFSRAECEEFFDRANLFLRKMSSEAIYEWTAGNPRMTWEICAAIEMSEVPTDKIAPQNVEAIVRKLYLTDFDRPPIDHIRSLVADDNLLKNALISIRYGKGSAIDSKTKGRLYLAGITRTPSAEPTIKNRIIDAALSDAWLAQVVDAKTPPTVIASEHFAGKRYGMVVESLRAVDDLLEPLPPLSRLQLGISLFHLDEFSAAAEQLQAVVDQFAGEARTTAQYYLGASLLYSNLIDESIQVLEDAAENGSGSMVLATRILVVSAYYRSTMHASGARSMELRSQLASELQKVSDQERWPTDVLASSLYSLALSAAGAGDMDATQHYFDLAMALAPVEMRPSIGISAAAYATHPGQKTASVVDAAEAVLQNSLRFSSGGEAVLSFREQTLAALVLLLLECNLTELTTRIVDYSLSLFRDLTTRTVVLLKLAEILSANGAKSISALLHYIEKEEDSTGHSIAARLALQRLHASQAPAGEREARVAAFYSVLTELDDADALSEQDALFIVVTVQEFATQSRTEDAVRWADLGAPLLMKTGMQNWGAVLLYFKMVVLNNAEIITAAKAVARQIIKLEDQLDKENIRTEGLGKFFENVFTHARRIIATKDLTIQSTFRGIGRNQKVVVAEPDGSNERTMKFKTAEAQIRTGSLALVRVLPR
jgi:hypothetical protein